MQRTHRTTLLTAAILAGSALAGAANAQVIRITNVNSPTGHDIPLKANSSVQIDSAGNLLAECALNAQSVCAALATGTNPNAPTATLTRTDTDTALTAGETVRLAWSSTNAEACKATTAGPNNVFTGVKPTALSGGELVTVSEGSYTFGLTCYNASGGSQASTVPVTVGPAAGGGGGGGGTGENCNITSNDPAFNPTNFQRVEDNWTNTFSAPDGDPSAVYPKGVSFPNPVGASRGTYLVVPFIPNPAQTINLYWDQVQPRQQDGYATPRPAEGMFVAISPCKGDLRAPVQGASDLFLRPGCRIYAASASLIWSVGTMIDDSNDTACKLNAGQTYYLHFLPANPAGGLNTGEETCEETPSAALGCDIGVRLSTGPG